MRDNLNQSRSRYRALLYTPQFKLFNFNERFNSANIVDEISDLAEQSLRGGCLQLTFRIKARIWLETGSAEAESKSTSRNSLETESWLHTRKADRQAGRQAGREGSCLPERQRRSTDTSTLLIESAVYPIKIDRLRCRSSRRRCRG